MYYDKKEMKRINQVENDIEKSMDKTLEEEVKKYLESTEEQRILPGETRLNVSINHKFKFSYMHLDYVRELLEDDIKNIRYILLWRVKEKKF